MQFAGAVASKEDGTMQNKPQKMTVEELITLLLEAAKASSLGLDAPVRLKDWECTMQNVATLQVEDDANGDVLIRFDPGEAGD